MLTSQLPGLRSPVTRAKSDWVIRKLDDLIASLRPGDSLPGHKELMQEFQASERVILHALSVLHETGRIVRRKGKGTFVADQALERAAGTQSSSLTIADSRTVMAVAQPDHSFFDRCLQVLFRELAADNLHLVSRLIDPAAALQFAPPPASERPLGFIIFRASFAPLANQLLADGNRVVLVGAPTEDTATDVPTVYSDHTTGGYLAVRHLVDLGHRRIAFAGSSLQQRRHGNERALMEARSEGAIMHTTMITLDTMDVWDRDPSLAEKFMRSPDAPTGIVAWNDHEAAILLSIFARTTVRVPNNVSVIGYDNVPESSRVHPMLTTIDAGIPQIVRSAVELLTGALPPKRAQTIMIVPALVIRASTATPPLPQS